MKVTRSNNHWRTTLGSIMTAIGLIPAGIEFLHLAVMPEWLMTVGLAASFLSFIYTGWSTADRKEV